MEHSFTSLACCSRTLDRMKHAVIVCVKVKPARERSDLSSNDASVFSVQ